MKTVMKEIMRSGGGNDFKIPHLKKKVARKAGNEIQDVHCDAETILKANEYIDDALAQ